MKTLGNILWHIPFLGFLNAALVYIIGVLLTLTVVGAPLGRGLMEFGKFLFWPFGYTMVNKKDLGVEQNKAWKILSIIISIIYIPFGILLAIFGAIQSALLCITIIGIPQGLVIAKSLKTLFNPVNKIRVPVAVAKELERRKAIEFIDKMQAKQKV